MKFALYLCLFGVPLIAQTASPAGVASEWDVRKLVESMGVQAQHLRSIVDQLKPETWVQLGAPETYNVQWKAAQAELGYFLSSSDALARQPEKLTLALDTLFRMQAMNFTLSSLVEGARKYQGPALADTIQSAIGENSMNQERLRQYVQDLAEQKEQEFRVADGEAQRCRAALLQQPAVKERERKSSR